MPGRASPQQSSRSDVFEVEPATGGDLFGTDQLTQCGNGRVHDVDRVVGAERLREHVVDAGALETARTGPPAMTPVPGLAGLSSTTPAAASPCTGCGIVCWMRGTLKNAFLASSTPLAIAAGTSLALP